MPEFTVRSDAVDVEQLMEQIRARVREKRGVDYTEEEIRELATVKLEKFLDPTGVRSDLLDQYRRAWQKDERPLLNSFGEDTLFESHRPLLRVIRRLLKPILKLFFNPNPLIQALHLQAKVEALEPLRYELMHNLVVELTRAGIELKNLKMRVESLTGRLEFNERRARALESLVVYKPEVEAAAAVPSEAAPRPRAAEPLLPREASIPSTSTRESPPSRTASPPSDDAVQAEGPGQRSRRRRRRRGRRGGASATSVMGGEASSSGSTVGDDAREQEERSEAAATDPSREGPHGGHSPAAPEHREADRPALSDSRPDPGASPSGRDDEPQ